MVIEMPVLDNALLWSALAFTPPLVALTFGEPVMKLHRARARERCRGGCFPTTATSCSTSSARNRVPAARCCRDCSSGASRPHRSERRTFEVPTLVLGHRRDPVHPFSDAGMLAEELPNGRLLEADSLLELRMHPERLTGEIASFLDEVWSRSAGPCRGASKRSEAHARRIRLRARRGTGYLAGNSSISLTLTCPGAVGVPIEAAGAADPQQHEAKRFRRVAQLDLLVARLLLDLVGAQRDPCRVGDRGGRGAAVGAEHLDGHARAWR